MRIDEEFIAEHFEKLSAEIKLLQNTFLNKQDFISDPFIDNARFMQLMGISVKTAQSWRDNRLVSFSQIGNKIYYRVSDIKQLLEKNHWKSNTPV
jgi:hypothetical protein